MPSNKNLLLVVALICFILAAFGVPSTYVNVLAVGLAFWVGAQLIG